MIFPHRRTTIASTRSLTLLIVGMLALGIGGCATVAPPTAPEGPIPEWQSVQLIESLAERRKQFRSLRSLAQVEYSGPEGKHAFQEAVIVQRPDRLRLETLSFLGAILIFTVNDKEMIGYHPREGVFVRGRGTKENLRRYTQIPLELEEVTLLLMGLPPLDDAASAEREGKTLVFSANGRKRDVLFFESQQPVPTRWERLNEGGAVELSARFGNYISTPSGLFPSHILLEALGQKKKLEIRYQQPELNAAIAPEIFTQQIPAHAKEVPIEAIDG